MKKDLFDELVESVREGGAISRGDAEAARQTQFPPVAPAAAAAQVFAVCVESDDSELLIPRKIYQVANYDAELVGVRDETGETAIYPSHFFVVIELPSAARAAFTRSEISA